MENGIIHFSFIVFLNNTVEFGIFLAEKYRHNFVHAHFFRLFSIFWITFWYRQIHFFIFGAENPRVKEKNKNVIKNNKNDKNFG